MTGKAKSNVQELRRLNLMRAFKTSLFERRDPRSGFTLLEVMIVLAIIVIIIGMAAGRYERSLVKAKESVLHQDLRVMRDAIQQYTLDKQAAPQSLDDLVSSGYMREVPTDPITQRKDWQVQNEDVLLSPDQTATGITDVHSSANAVSPFESTPYNTW